MDIELSPDERAHAVIGHHTTGVICAGEVLNQFVDFVTPDSVGAWIRQFTPELDRYFRRIASEADFSSCRSDKERVALQLLIDWYDTHVA